MMPNHAISTKPHPIWGLYRGITACAAPILTRLLDKRCAEGKEIPSRIQEKRGQTALPRPEGALIWMHGASVGESLSMLPFIDKIRALYPNRPILVTTGTRTSAELMEKRLPQGIIHQFYPLDHPGWVRQFLDHWRPSVALWFESELWPNMLHSLKERQIPVLLLNARMSDKSFAKWQKWPKMIGDLLGVFDIIMAQSQHDYDYYRQLPPNNIHMPGNLKYAAGDLPADAALLDDLRHVIGTRPVWCAASTHPGEEEHILLAHEYVLEHHPDTLLILVPRHPERGAALEENLNVSTLGPMARRGDGQVLSADTAIYLADTLGEMGLWYRLPSIVFVGGSFKPIGGHNPLEPARLGCAVLFGPQMFNFKAIAQSFAAAETDSVVADGRALGERVSQLLDDDVLRTGLGEKARHVALQETSVADRVMDLVQPILKKTAR